MTPEQYYADLQRRMKRQLEARRQEAADQNAAQRVVGTPEQPKETDPGGFWSTVGDLAEGAWGEMGQATEYGFASAVDETANTALESLGISHDATSFRRWMDAKTPETAGGNMLAGLVQFGTGAATFFMPAGWAVKGASWGARGARAALGRGKGAKTAQEGAQELTEGAAAGAGARMAGAAKEALVGRTALSFAASDYAAFAADEQRMLVAMNEIPAFADIIPDWMAADDPDDPKWMQRMERALEGHLLGAGLEMAVRAAAHFVRSNRKGLAHKQIEAPNREQAQEAMGDRAVRDTDGLVRSMFLAAGKEPPEAVGKPAQLYSGEITSYGEVVDYFANPASEQALRTQFDVAAEVAEFHSFEAWQAARVESGKPLPRDTPPPREEPAPEPEPEPAPADPDEGFVVDEEGNIIEGDPFADDDELAALQRMAGDEDDPSAAFYDAEDFDDPDLRETFQRFMAQDEATKRQEAYRAQFLPKSEEDFQALRAVLDPEWMEDHLALGSVAGDTAGLSNVGTAADREAFLLAEHHGFQRLREWQAAPHSPERWGAAVEAMAHYQQRYAVQAAHLGPEGRAAVPELAARQENGTALVEDALLKTRDHGRRYDTLDQRRAAATDSILTEPLEAPAAVRAAEPADFGVRPRDRHLAVQRPDRIDGLAMNPAYRTARYDESAAINAPRTVQMAQLRSVDDFGRLVDEATRAVVSPRGAIAIEGRRQAEAAMPLADEITRAKEQFNRLQDIRRAAREQAAAGLPEGTDPKAAKHHIATAEGVALDEAGISRLQRRSITRDFAAVREKEKALEAAREEEAAAMRAETEAEDARGKLNALMYDQVDRTWRLREDVNAQGAMAAVDAMAGTVHRLAQSVADDLTDSAAAAELARALQKQEGLHAWLGGRREMGPVMRQFQHATAEDAMRRSQYGVEADIETSQRRLNDYQLIAQSGGIKALRDTAYGIAAAQETDLVLNMHQRWKGQSRYAWSMKERMGLHHSVPTALQIMFSNYLSGPATHAVNLISGAGMTVLRTGEDFAAGAFFGEFAGTAAEASPRMAATKRLASTMRAAVPGFWDGLRLAAYHVALEATNNTRWREGIEGVIQRQNLERVYAAAMRHDHFEETLRQRRMGTPELLKDMVENERARAWVDGLGDAAGMTVGGGWVTTLMQGGDVFVKAINHRMQLQHDAVTGALKKGLTGEAYAQEVDRFLRDPEKMMGDAMERARLRGELNTFMEDPGKYTKAALEFTRRYPSVRLLVPFIRTPGNQMRQALERIPFSEKLPLLKLFVEEHDRLAVKGSPEDRARLNARRLTGGALIVGASWLAYEDRITGRSPANREMAHTRRAMGVKDYAIRLGDGTWVGYNQIGGRTATMLALIADGWELVQAADTPEEITMAEVGMSLVSSVVGMALDETALSNLVDIGDAVNASDGRQQAVALARIASRHVLAATVPGHGAMGAALDRWQHDGVTNEWRVQRGYGGSDEGVYEAIMEEALSAIGQMKDQIWWIGTDSDRFPRRGWDGEPLVRAYPGRNSRGEPVSMLMSSFSQSKFMEEDASPEAQAILDVGYPVPRVPRTRVVKEQGITGTGAQDRTLEYTRAEYDELQRITGQRFKKRVGQIMRRQRWKNDMALWREGGMSSHREALKRQMGEAWAWAHKQAQREVQARSPDLQRRIMSEERSMLLERRKAMGG